jgi:NTP pyrophosphatase (non-canonical NTP hydrolase)
MALTRLALITSEIGEAVDAVRHGNPPSDHIPEYDGLSEELADVLIRCFDLAGYLKLPLAEATIAKMAFNESRPFMHGKNS